MSFVVRWDGENARHIGTGLDGVIYDFETYNGELIAAGSFLAAVDEPFLSIARRTAETANLRGTPRGEVAKWTWRPRSAALGIRGY